LKKLVENENSKAEKLVLIITNILSRESNYKNMFYCVIFFVENSIISTLTKFCSDDFVLEIVNKLFYAIKTSDIRYKYR
jgi:hypothetical protein